jgi:hypothetical protein
LKETKGDTLESSMFTGAKKHDRPHSQEFARFDPSDENEVVIRTLRQRLD